MSLAIFNINDAGIQLSLDGDHLRTSPGYAVVHDNNLMIGEEAADNTKLLPRWTNSRFWSKLTTAPLEGGTSQIRHHADLAFAHLEALWQPIADRSTAAVFVVPGYFSGEHLSLLLGMAKECGIPLRGVVDNSVVAASNLALHRNILHLDIHLHAITLTRLHSSSGSVTRHKVEVVLETGLATLRDRWADIIANQLIQTTRFDPMHNADSEQQLFNLLPGWIRQLGSEQMQGFSMKSAGVEHSVAVSRESLMRACAPLYPQIVQAVRSEMTAGEPASLMLSHHFEGFPGLLESLHLIADLEITDLHESKTLGSAYLHRDQILSASDSAISHILQLKSGAESEPNEPTSPRKPTHLLWGDTAYPIGRGRKLPADTDSSSTGDSSVYLRDNQLILEPGNHQPFTVNGETIDSPCTLDTGDVIKSGDQELTVITVLTDG